MTKLGVVFPGQGSQSVGMMAEAALQFPLIQQTFEHASAILGYDLWQLVQEGPAETLDQTQYTQPALLTASYAFWKIWQSFSDEQPALLAGHSLGEYTALLCADAISFEDAVRLVAARGRFMQEAVPAGTGAMAAIIGLDNADVEMICKAAEHSAEEVISPANYNSPGQIVVAGHKAPVLRAMQLAKEKGAKLVIPLPVSVPSHCLLMQPAASHLQKFLSEVTFKMPSITLINNVNAKPYDTIEAIKAGLVKQLYSPVRWVETIQFFINAQVTRILECGPGKVLSGLNKRIDKNLILKTTSDVMGAKHVS